MKSLVKANTPATNPDFYLLVFLVILAAAADAFFTFLFVTGKTNVKIEGDMFKDAAIALGTLAINRFRLEFSAPPAPPEEPPTPPAQIFVNPGVK